MVTNFPSAGTGGGIQPGYHGDSGDLGQLQDHLLDIWRARVDYPTLKAKVEELAKRWKANQVLIEEAGTKVERISPDRVKNSIAPDRS